MNSLDSRYLEVGECYGHRFSRAGVIAYELSHLLLPASAADAGRGSALRITVAAPEDRREAQQHHVTVTERHGTLQAHPAELRIVSGDSVLWIADRSVKLGFCVRSTGELPFDSSALTSDSLYTHAFTRPGRYEWRDAHGSKLHGTVVVTAAKDGAIADWLDSLTAGTLVYVRGDVATPETLEVTVGQTVFWAIANADGISITDVTALRRGKPGDGDGSAEVHRRAPHRHSR